MEENFTILENQNNRMALPARKRLALWGVFLALLILVGVVFYRTWATRQADTAGISPERISAEMLAERYGLQVRLIGVTAGGGMVDFRLKILDAEKAGQLLYNPDKALSLYVEESDTRLYMPADIQEETELVDGGVFLVLFPNSGGAVRPGTEVIVQFGEIQVEPIPAQ